MGRQLRSHLLEEAFRVAAPALRVRRRAAVPVRHLQPKVVFFSVFVFLLFFFTEFFFGVQVQAPQRPTAAPAQDPQRRVDQLRRRRRRHGDLDADADGDADAAGGGTASSAASAASSAASSAAAAASAAAADPVRPRPPPRAAAGLFTAPAPPAEPAPPPPPPPLELELTVPCRANRDPGPDLPVTHPTTSTTRAQGTDTLTPIVTMIGTLI